ncbi:hypothetical protein PtB15_11B619 [Puccinia triticina]|nr:hypothetical protein PtB15_11B619 [Puccinia triticina]
MAQNTTSSTSNITSEESKLKQISDLIKKLHWVPKSYFEHFLNAKSAASICKRRLWGSPGPGWDSTKRLLESIKRVVRKYSEGKQLWDDFIMEEATLIICRQKPTTGKFPRGSYYSSHDLNEAFFTPEARAERSDHITDSMKFLYNLLMNKLARPDTGDNSDDEEEDTNTSCVNLPPLEPPLPSPDAPHPPPLDPSPSEPLDPNAKIPIALSEDDVMELKQLMHLLNIESGMNVIQQSHQNQITNISMNSFISFAKQYNICLAEEKPDDFIPILTSDVYDEGISTMKEDFKNRKGGLDRLKPAYMFDQAMDFGSESSHGSNNSSTSDNSNDSDKSKSSKETSESSGTSDDSDSSGE